MGKKKQRNRKIAGKILIVIGSFIIVLVIAINVIDLVKSTIAINDFKKSQSTTVVKKSDDDDQITSLKLAPSVELEEIPDEKETMCLLRISKINLEEAVKEGSTKGVLSSALGHVENTALPGKDGNCCIAGHRNYSFGKFFNRLDEVTLGDVIELETKDSLYTYEVVSIEVVEPEEVSVLDYVEGKNLTLITCTPFMIGTHRLIVHAILV